MDENAYDLNPISIHGYNGYWNFSKFTTGYSGVAVFSKYMARSMTEDFF
jgi:exonuclease III